MQLDIRRLTEGGECYEGEDPPSILELENDDFCAAENPIHYALHVQIVSDELIITGRLWTEARFRCSRCAEFTPVTVKVSDFGRSYDLKGDEVLWVPGMPESVDLTPDIREAIILHFPSYPVCDFECRGLCASCGVNLNLKSCSCAKPSDVRWDALDQIKIS